MKIREYIRQYPIFCLTMVPASLLIAVRVESLLDCFVLSAVVSYVTTSLDIRRNRRLGK